MIYLDAAATLPTSNDVRDRIVQVLDQNWGNVSGAHEMSRNAKNVLELAREKTAIICEVNPDNIVFTSGATEALNLAIQGYIKAHKDVKIFCSEIEHPAAYKTVQALEAAGADVTYIGVNNQGELNVSQLDDVSQDDLVCIMAVNNEIGVVNDIESIAKKVHDKGGMLIVDAAQSFYSYIPSQITKEADFTVFSGHKLGTPQGVGALVIKKRSLIEPLVYGGSQEWELRPGTTPAFLCDSFAYVFERENNTRESAISNVELCRDAFINGIARSLDNISFNAKEAKRSPHIVSVNFHGIESQVLVTMLDSKGLCVSKGSACASGATTPSRVMLAIGNEVEGMQSTLRFSFSRNTSLEEVDQAIEIVSQCVNQLRSFETVGSNV